MRLTTFAIVLAAGVSAQSDSESTTTTVQIRHFSGVAQFLGTVRQSLTQVDGAPLLAKFAPVASQFLEKLLPPSIQNVGQLGSSLSSILPELYTFGLGEIPTGVLDGPEYQAALVDSKEVIDFVGSAASNVLAVFPSNLAISDVGSFIQASSDAAFSSVVSVALSALPAAQTLLISIEHQAFPSGIPSDSSCTPTAGSAPGSVPTPFPSGVAAPTGIYPTGGFSSGNSSSNSTVPGLSTSPATVATGAAPGLTISRGVVGSAIAASVVGMLVALM